MSEEIRSQSKAVINGKKRAASMLERICIGSLIILLLANPLFLYLCTLL